MNLKDLAEAFAGLSETDRPMRLRLSHQRRAFDNVVLVKCVTGHEALCGGLEYRLLCISTRADLPLKELIALPVELQFVTDRGDMRAVCGIVAQAAAGQSDGGLATYQLVVRDALALMNQRVNTRVFRNINEVELSAVLLSEWRAINPILANAFDIDMSRVSQAYPAREFIMQHNESDAMFLQRLWKRRGISWFIRPGKASDTGSDRTPAHTLVLFDSSNALAQNAAGAVQFRQDRATQTADSINNWVDFPHSGRHF
jgi:type VI secretion system secreted protein VgrG